MNNHEFVCTECKKHYYDVEDGGLCPECLMKYGEYLEKILPKQ